MAAISSGVPSRPIGWRPMNALRAAAAEVDYGPASCRLDDAGWWHSFDFPDGTKAQGAHPVEAVSTMRRVATVAEQHRRRTGRSTRSFLTDPLIRRREPGAATR